MNTNKTPQEKKQLSYQKDHKDNYGEFNKGSRKSVPRKKQFVNQNYRQNINQILKKSVNTDDLDQMENKIKETKKIDWKKSGHEPLGLSLNRKGKLDISKIKTIQFRNGKKPNLENNKQKTN
jgi:hypothetical protein